MFLHLCDVCRCRPTARLMTGDRWRMEAGIRRRAGWRMSGRAVPSAWRRWKTISCLYMPSAVEHFVPTATWYAHCALLMSSKCSHWKTHTYTHATLNGPFSRTTRVSRYRKGKTNLNFIEARDSEWQWHQLGHMQICTSLQTDNRASTPPLSFLQGGCSSCPPTNSAKSPKDA